MTTSTRSASYVRGAGAVAPVLLGVAPFGVVVGITARTTGFQTIEALGFSVALFAGASQLASMELLVEGAPVWVAILTAAAINLRMSMYSASLRPHLQHLTWGRRLLASYLLTDHTFAVSVARFKRRTRITAMDPWWFYLGTSTALWATWQLSTILGAEVAPRIPEALPLGFAVPLTFLGLLVPSITDRPRVAAAVTGGTTATLASGFPANLGMPLGALVGIAVGAALTVRQRGDEW